VLEGPPRRQRGGPAGFFKIPANDFYVRSFLRQSHEGEIDMQHHITFRRAVISLCLSLAILCLACGCSFLYRGARGEALGRNPSNPFPDIKKVAITPFATDEASASVPLERSLTYAEAFASELAQFPGFEVVRAYSAASDPPPQQPGYGVMVSGGESRDSAKDLDVDAVIIGSITEYDPYTPRIGITLTLIRARGAALSAENAPRFTDLELLAQTGRPIVVREHKTGKVLAVRIERIFDSRQDVVKNQIKLYAFTRSGNESPAGTDQFLRESNYIQFISNMMIRELLKTAEEEDGARRDD